MNGTFGGGSGSSSDPYLVEDVYDFCAMNSLYYKLVNDIDFNDHDTYKNGISQTIVNSANVYGNNMKVKNMVILDSSKNMISNAIMRDVDFENVYFLNANSSNTYCGFVGDFYNCRMYLTLINSRPLKVVNSATRLYNSAITLTGDAIDKIEIPGMNESHLHFKNYVLKNGSTKVIPISLYAYREVKRSYITGEITVVPTGYASSIQPISAHSDRMVDWSYIAVKLNRNGLPLESSAESGAVTCKNGSFLDYELMGYETKPDKGGLFPLSTAECKDVDKLNSIGFLCVKAD